jgi:Predicted membrane protein (DUF2232)
MRGFAWVWAALPCGAAAAALYLSLMTGSAGAAILVSLAQFPLFLAGLWLGTSAAALAGCTAVAIVLASARDAAATGLFAGLYAIPVILLVREALQARPGADGGVEWYPAGALTGWLTGLGLGGIAMALLWLGGPETLQSLLRRALAPAFGELVGTTAAERAMLIHALAAIFPGLLAASWMMLVVTNGILAQGVLARFGANWRPSPPIVSLRLPIWIVALLGAAAGAVLLGEPARFLGINVMIMLSIPFCLAGLAVVHAAAGRLARPAIPLVVFYVLAGLFGWPLLLVAILGLVDVPLDLRRRLAGSHPFGGKLDG